MCHQKDPTFFRSLSPKDPHFYQLSPNDPLFFKNFDIFDEMLRNFLPFWPWKPLFLMHCTERPPIFVRFVTQRPPFLMQFVTERPLHLRCLVALVRHFHMRVPPPGVFLCKDIFGFRSYICYRSFHFMWLYFTYFVIVFLEKEKSIIYSKCQSFCFLFLFSCSQCTVIFITCFKCWSFNLFVLFLLVLGLLTTTVLLVFFVPQIKLVYLGYYLENGTHV